MKIVGYGLCGLVLAATGCSQGPARIAAPSVDPETAARQALESYDANHDGSLDKKELTACPGMLVHMSLYDQNSDGLVSGDEISARLRDLYGQRVALAQIACNVQFQGRPLPDAQVVFEPESYLGDEIPEATGTTGKNGSAQMSIPAEELPESLRDRRMKFIKIGTYKVRVTHPSIKLPEKYNSSTVLGYESELGNPTATYELSAK